MCGIKWKGVGLDTRGVSKGCGPNSANHGDNRSNRPRSAAMTFPYTWSPMVEE